MPRPILTARQYGWITLGFVLFVIYGSLVPLNYQPVPFDRAWQLFVFRFSQPIDVNQRADWLANILLFVPLGFLAMGWRCVDRPYRRLRPIFFILPACTILSALLEFVQIWFPPRYTSLDDVVAETIGAVIGIGLWLVAGRCLTAIFRRFWATYAVHNWAIRLVPGYLLFLVFVSGMPFDLTLSPSALKRKDNAHMILLTPFTVVGGDVFDLIRRGLMNAAFFMPAGVLMAGLPVRRLRNPSAGLLVFLVGLALAGTIELMQLFVMSRYFDTTDIITGSLAVLGGWIIMRKWQKNEQSPCGFSGGQGACLLLACAAALVFIHWEPFHFRGDSAFLTSRWQHVSLVPFMEYYDRDHLHSLNDMLQKTLLFMPAGLLMSRTTPSRVNWAIVVGFAFLFAVVLEMGQFFLPDRHPVVSDVLVETFGAGLGLLAAIHLRALIASD